MTPSEENTPEQEFSVFSNGSEYRDWTARNCDRCSVCGPRDFGPSKCALETALSMASMLDGNIPVSLGVEFGAVTCGQARSVEGKVGGELRF